MRLLLLALFVSPYAVFGASTIDVARPYAYSANADWVHFRPSAADGASIHDYHLAGKAYGSNFGWIDLGDGTPGAGHIYSNAAAFDCGVNHDGAGNLQAYAYSGNLGWIDFGWALASDPNRAYFDLFTGQFPSLRIAAISQVSGFSVTTLECPTRGTRLYTLETSTTLLPGSWSSLGYFAGTGFLSAYNHNTVVEPKRFYRLGSKLPLRPQ